MKGRGASSSAQSLRFRGIERVCDGDWRDYIEKLEGPPVKLRTHVVEEHPKSILTFNTSPDIGFDRSINAYRGCEHGCIYCFARPTHAYHELSPGLDFETRLFAKPKAATLLRQTFAKSGYKPKPIAMGTNTDPYQPIEKRYRITREILELCLEVGHPVTITTKSDRVLADIELLREMAKRKLVAVALSVTSLDANLSGKLEPRAASPIKRMAAISRLSEAGIPVHCSISPVIPAITDEFLEEIVERASECGAWSVGWIMLRLPNEVAPLFREWLDVHFPDRAQKVLNIVRDMRGGRDNEPNFHARFNPKGVWADLFRARFRTACRRSGLEKRKIALNCDSFTAPRLDGQILLI